MYTFHCWSANLGMVAYKYFNSGGVFQTKKQNELFQSRELYCQSV